MLKPASKPHTATGPAVESGVNDRMTFMSESEASLGLDNRGKNQVPEGHSKKVGKFNIANKS
jgi:hypothetical protein